MIVDAQVHVWAPESDLRPWPPGGRERAHLPGGFSYEALLTKMDLAGVDRAVIVPPSWEGDRIDYALEAARDHPDRLAVMGRIAIDDPASKALLHNWLSIPGMRGVRTMFSRQQAGWLKDGTADWFWREAERLHIPVMVHSPGHSPLLGDIAQAHPNLELIVDHMNLSSEIKMNGTIREAIAATARLARHDNVSVKVSSVPNFSGERFPFADMVPHLKTIISAFGADRCFWGSDLTHSHGKIPYEHHLKLFTERLDFLSSDELRLILGDGLSRKLRWVS